MLCIPPIKFSMAEPLFMKYWYVYHGTWAHLNGVLNISFTSVCIYTMYPLTVARQRLRQNPPIVAMQRFGKEVTAATNTKTTIEELLDVSISMRSVSYQGKRRLVLPRTCLYFKIYKDTTRIRSLNMHVSRRPYTISVYYYIQWPFVLRFRGLRVRITNGRKLRATKAGHDTQIHMRFPYDQFVQKIFVRGRGVPNGLDDTRSLSL
jgi:hypothetical protein